MKEQVGVVLGLLLGALNVARCSAGQAPASPQGAGPLQPARIVVGTVLTSVSGPPIRIRVRPNFRYAGGQRFILREVADAEQHCFVETSSQNAVSRAYWIQFEQFLPGRSGKYAYESDQPMNLAGLSMRVHVRRFTEPPAADSDRQRAYDLLAKAGFVVPSPATRVRLVHLPEADGRQELMIIYLEPAETTAELTPEEGRAIIQRATEGLSISR